MSNNNDRLEEIYDPQTAAWVRANCVAMDPTIIQDLVAAKDAAAETQPQPEE